MDVIYEAIYNIKRGREDDIPYDNEEEYKFFIETRDETANRLLDDLQNQMEGKKDFDSKPEDKYSHLMKSLKFERLE